MLYGSNPYSSVSYGGLTAVPADVVVAASIVEAAIATYGSNSVSQPSTAPAESGSALLYVDQAIASLSATSVAVSAHEVSIAFSLLSIQQQQALVDAVGRSIDALSGVVDSLPGQANVNTSGISAIIASAFCSAILAQASSTASSISTAIAAASPNSISYQSQVSAVSLLIQSLMSELDAQPAPAAAAAASKELLTQVSGIIFPFPQPGFSGVGSAVGQVSPLGPQGITQQTAIEAISGALGAGFAVLAALPSPGLLGASTGFLAVLADTLSAASQPSSASAASQPLLTGAAAPEARTLVLAFIQAIMGSIAAIGPAYSASPALSSSSRPSILTSARSLSPAAGPAITPAAAATGLLLAAFADAAPGAAKASPSAPVTAVTAGLSPGTTATASSVASLLAAIAVISKEVTGKATNMLALASAASGILGLSQQSISVYPGTALTQTVLISLGPQGLIAFRPLTYLVVEVIDARLGYFKATRLQIGSASAASMAVGQGFLLGCEVTMASIERASLRTARAVAPVLTED